MPLNFWMSAMSVAEFLLWATLGFLFWKKGLQKRFPALNLYLLLRVGSMPILLGLLYVQAQPWGHQYFRLLLLFLLGCLHRQRDYALLRNARDLPFGAFGLFRPDAARNHRVPLGGPGLSSCQPGIGLLHHPSSALLPDFALALMRSVSILELCLLAFLCLCINALQLSFRDLCFRLRTWLRSDVCQRPHLRRLSSTVNLISHCSASSSPMRESCSSPSSEWVAYCAMPERARKPVVMPASSTIYRWNEIASALGHGTKVAVRQPANGFFLTDVERVVEKVLTRNLQSESKS